MDTAATEFREGADPNWLTTLSAAPAAPRFTRRPAVALGEADLVGDGGIGAVPVVVVVRIVSERVPAIQPLAEYLGR